MYYIMGVVVIIVIIIVVLILLYGIKMIYNRSKSPYIMDKNLHNIGAWPSVYPPTGVNCATADTGLNCIYADVSKAKHDCTASPNCIGYWTRDGAWIKRPGPVYQLASSMATVPSTAALATFYKKNM